jgi:antitoxin MazE
MRTNIIRIGNSRGIRIPKPLLEQAGLGETVQLVAKKGQLIIQPDRAPREGWAEAFAAAEKSGQDRAILGEITNVFDLEDWTW